MIRNIIFDWSGTLVDDLPAVWAASNHVFRRAGVPELSLETFRAEFRLPFKGFYDQYVPHVPLPELEEWFHAHFRANQDSVTALPHAREFLEFCRARGVRTFLLSTVHASHFEVQQARTGLGGYLDRPYVGVWDKKARIHDILAENGLALQETMFVGDMEHDIETARHGGIGSAAVLTGYNRLEQLRAAGPDVIVEHLGELRQMLERQSMRLHPLETPAGPPRRPIVTVGAVIFDETGRVLMIRTDKWSGRWGIPGGKIEFGEPAEDALRRELREETGLEVTEVRFVLVQDCIHSREFYRDEHFVLLNYTCRRARPDPVRLNDEAQEFRWLPLAEAFKLPLNQPTKVLLDAIVASAPRSPGHS